MCIDIGLLYGIIIALVICVFILFYICYRQQMRLEWHKHIMSNSQLHIADIQNDLYRAGITKR